MRRNLCFYILALLLGFSSLFAQEPVKMIDRLQLGIMGGASFYNGSLSTVVPKFGAGATLSYEVLPTLHVRVGIWLSELEASDRGLPNTGFDSRRSEYYFKTNLNEFSFAPVYSYTLPFAKAALYMTAGIAMYNFEPYQEVKGYRADGSFRYYNLALTKPVDYSNWQWAFPVGGGIKYVLNDKLAIGAEALYRVTTNKYLDNFNNEDGMDCYFTSQLGLFISLGKKRTSAKKHCNCPVW